MSFKKFKKKSVSLYSADFPYLHKKHFVNTLKELSLEYSWAIPFAYRYPRLSRNNSSKNRKYTYCTD